LNPQPPKKKPAPLPSNAKAISDYTLDELKKTANSRGIPVAKLIAQMIEEYLREDKKGAEGGKTV
jgi:hypothetical protein